MSNENNQEKDIAKTGGIGEGTNFSISQEMSRVAMPGSELEKFMIQRDAQRNAHGGGFSATGATVRAGLYRK